MNVKPGKDMSRPALPPAATPEDHDQPEPGQHTSHRHGHGRGHGLMMLACCVPMLLVAFALVASGVAEAGAILYALLCAAMMTAMMFIMPGHRH